MPALDRVKPGTIVRGISTHDPVTIQNIKWHGSALEVFYTDDRGQPGTEILYESQADDIRVVEAGRQWSLNADGHMLRLVSEAQRIRWAHLFDPFVAVNTSEIEPLPHQITAVYEEMLPRQPLRYMLADDPGSGKTIMTGLYLKELVIRGDLQRCLIVVPGNLVEQWQDELKDKFNLTFSIFTRDMNEAAHSGNAFLEHDLLVARMDQLARGEDLIEKLKDTDWDLIVVDEAHKLSATYFGNEVKLTKRYKLGEQLAGLTRHFLLLTATPHNGKEKEFQKFMQLLDADRFEGMYREGTHSTNVSDLMRRMVKEKLTRFDGTPLFPERRAYTVSYQLSAKEDRLYTEVSRYVREEFNRAEQYLEGGRRGSVGFALTVLQRRLASSPAAIHASLKRRRERLQKRRTEAELNHRVLQHHYEELDEEDLDYIDETPAEELEALEEQLVDEATAARTVQELEKEIKLLQRLEGLARDVLRSGEDKKWEQLSRILQDQEHMFDANGRRRKLVIFTEHRDTLEYLMRRIRTMLGKEESVVTIHGGVRREIRRQVQDAFTQDKDVHILVATDAAGEGINLQRAHLMINYDLPWNPNRLEQRFGRIHRIGQTEVCHLWNLVAKETREGDVYETLLRKLEQERDTLGGAVFDVLGKAIEGKELRKLMIEAIRYGDRPEIRARLTQQVEGALSSDRLHELMAEEALSTDVVDMERLASIREEMERAQARKLQPHYIASFFIEAFTKLGGSLYEREDARYEITRVPPDVQQRARRVTAEGYVRRRYERICFERERVRVQGKPEAEFVTPGHPLLAAVLDLVLERYRGLMKQGGVLVAEGDMREAPRALVYLEHVIEDGRTNSKDQRLVASRRFQFAEGALIDGTLQGSLVDAGPAPYLNYRPLHDDERHLIQGLVDEAREDADVYDKAVSFAIAEIGPRHLEEVKCLREPLVKRQKAAVKDRLTKEIQYWDHRAQELRAEEEAGKELAGLNSARAQQRADQLEARLKQRLTDLDKEQRLSARPPRVVGGALVIPEGLITRLRGKRTAEPGMFARETTRVERAAMARVMAAERALGYEPKDVGDQNLGYDVESTPKDGKDGPMRFIEVKGRIAGADSVTITRNEILTALNKPDNWYLALVEVPLSEDMPESDAFVIGDSTDNPFEATDHLPVRYVHAPPFSKPGFAATSVNFRWQKYWDVGFAP